MESSNQATPAATDLADAPLAQTPADVADQPLAQPQGATDERRGDSARGSRSSRHGSRSRSGSRRGEHSSHVSTAELSRDRRRRQLWAARALALTAIVTSVVLSLLLIQARAKVATHGMENGTLASELNRTQSELLQTKQLVAAQEVELGALLKQRIPGVTNLELEKLYEINKKQVKKLSFSEVGVGAEKRLAYYAVLKNTDAEPVVPAATILLFDRKGLQTGMARVTREAATTPSEREQLQPGETRAYSASIQPMRDDPPAYFLVEAR